MIALHAEVARTEWPAITSLKTALPDAAECNDLTETLTHLAR